MKLVEQFYRLIITNNWLFIRKKCGMYLSNSLV